MKIGIISDIHGNYEALKVVLDTLDKLQVSEIYSLGDVAGYYTQINECCEELIKRSIPNVMGNHDWYLTGGFCSRSKSANKCIEYQRKVVSESNLNWLRKSSIELVLGEIRMVHGGWSDPIDEYLNEPDESYFSSIDGKIFMSGHTHIQCLHKFKKKTYCNPGSVGQPRDEDPRAAFAVYDEGQIILHRVEYDIEKVFVLMNQAGFSDYFYGCLKTGARNLCHLS